LEAGPWMNRYLKWPPQGLDDILRNAFAAKDWISSKSNEIEMSRELSDDVVNLLIRIGAFRVNIPPEWDGPELDSIEQAKSSKCWLGQMHRLAGAQCNLIPSSGTEF
jgi:hypothetical protein